MSRVGIADERARLKESFLYTNVTITRTRQ
ncbi:hypothetical protein DFO68_10821 [Halomonas ventosae]|uniref:Uncharacterized protein n=1 Tax=Halomonas ventosae TaxID=229007 RepID=A0A4R6HHX1_9GAMM|nr:hypothetical protein DFO68_10821 [Halomonas ventosae]